MDIEVGEYIRTKDGYLGKLIAINMQDYNYLVVETSNDIRRDEYPATYLYLKNEDITKHSKHIIDLIEIGDYVNGKCCIDIEENYTDDGRRNLNLIYMGGSILELSSSIKTILTHEQYEQNCYRLEE